MKECQTGEEINLYTGLKVLQMHKLRNKFLKIKKGSVCKNYSRTLF